MSLEPGTYRLGPENAKLQIHTGRTGGAAKAGHDLTILVTAWSATVDAGGEAGEAKLALSVDSRSLQVLEGHGGLKALDDGDKDNIRQTIDDDVLKGTPIEFRSTDVASGDGPLAVQGDLELAGQTHPVTFELALQPAGRVSATATIRQTDWGIKPYSALFGALKVADEVRVEIAGALTR
jgi:polyisoprenoid-binding protein YceI